MEKIGILYICTGRYWIFWKDFYESCEKNFLKNYSKFYFVFTDSKELLLRKDINVKYKYQKKLGWPFDTLDRFQFFLNIEEELRKMDFLFFFNANALIYDEINSEILPIEEDLVGVQHPCFYNSASDTYIYERNSESLAYIPYGSGKYYFMGSFNGGKSKAFLEMTKRLNENIKVDKGKGIIALWHDESHLNHYFYQRSVKVLPPAYAYPQEMSVPFPIKILLRDKNQYGGHNYLRSKDGMIKRLLSFFLK